MLPAYIIDDILKREKASDNKEFEELEIEAPDLDPRNSGQPMDNVTPDHLCRGIVMIDYFS